jgi:uncharacterized GH25 family protein
MKHSAPCLAALALLLPGVALGHDFWIEPSTFRPAAGSDVEVALRVGQRLHGEGLPRIPMLIDRFFVQGGVAQSRVEGEPGADPAGVAHVAGAGLRWIAYQSHPFPVEVEAQKFEDYLKEEGLEWVVDERARKGQTEADGRERFHRCAKALLAAGGETKGDGTPAIFDMPLGLTLELVPRRNPYEIRPGGDLPLALLFRGKPAVNLLVVAMSKDDPEKAVSARTDARGLVTLRLAHSGFWLVKAVHMQAAPADAGVDWESWWASMTFDLPPAPRK